MAIGEAADGAADEAPGGRDPPRLALEPLCVPVPAAGATVCPVCHGFRRRGFELCTGCQRVRAQLATFCPLVVPVSLARSDRSPLYRVLCGYKDLRRPSAQRAVAAAQLSELFDAFVARHERCITRAAGAGWDCVTTVPSSGPHADPHPLVEVVRAAPELADRHAELLRRGPAAIGHLRADDAGYLATAADGRRVLLVDDSYTSGARAQSAVSALVRGGAEVVGVLAALRLVRPGFVNGAAWWDRQRRASFDPQRCCLECAQ